MVSSALERLSEAWHWRELDLSRCRELVSGVSQTPGLAELAAAQHSARPISAAKDTELAAAALVVWAYIAFREARQAEALEYATEALTLLSAAPESWWFSRALNARSCALLELGELEQATLNLRQQLRASRANGDTESEGSGLHDLGVMHTGRDPAHADGYLLAAQAIFDRTGHAVGRSFVAWSLGELRERQERLSEATLLYRSALTLARGCGHLFLEVLVLSRLGELELQRGDPATGERLLREALARQRADASRPLWITIPPLVRLLLHTGRTPEARTVLEAQLEGAQAAGMVVTQISVHHLLSEVEEALGHSGQALVHAREYIRLFGEQNAHEQAAKVRALEVLHRTELAEQEAQTQRQLNEDLRAALAQLETLHRQLETVSVTDELTGVYNRHYLMSRGLGLVRAQLQPANVAVAILDIDHFKAVNDTHGHDGGDRVLREFAQFLRSGLRDRDILTRFGGEEFVILFPNTLLEDAYGLLDRLRLDLRNAAFSEMPARFAVSFTAGVVNCPDGDLMAALRRADQLLYRGKRSGRNAVTREKTEYRPEQSRRTS